MEYDVFISHASEDKESFVAPLAKLLLDLGVKVWYDEFTLKLGDSLSRSIDRGLANSKFGIVVLSPAFIKKPWPEYELRGLVSREIGRDKVILPIWHGVTKDDILEFSPPLADKRALDTSRHDLHKIALDTVEVIRPDIYQNLIRLAVWKRIVSEATLKEANRKELHPGPIRHETLPEQLLVRIKLVHSVLWDVLGVSFDEMIDAFRRDAHPANEVAIWEKISVAYLEASHEKQMSREQRKQILSELLRESMGLSSSHK